MKRNVREILAASLLLMMVCAAHAGAQETVCGVAAPEDVTLLQEGMKLHDAGDYDGALNKYGIVLKRKPDCVNALYESAHSSEAKGDYVAGLQFARRGLECKSPLRANLYEKLASCYAGLEQYDSAIIAVDAGLVIDTTLAPLYRILGEIGISTQRNTAAAWALQYAVRLDPDEERYHALLGVAYGGSGRRLPAIMAMSAALALNPGSPRALDMINMIDGLWIAGLERADDGSARLSSAAFEGIRSTTTRDGNFVLAEMTASTMAADDMKDSASINSIRKIINRYDIIADLLGPMAPRDTSDHGFAREFYPGFFVELKERKFIEPFCYYIRQASGDPEVTAWVKSHDEELSKFLVWWREYKWPEGVKL